MPARSRKFKGKARSSGRVMRHVIGVNKVHTFRQVVQLDKIENNNLVGVGKGYKFKLNDLPQHLTFSALFDQYRIDNISIKFLPRSLPNLPSGTSYAADAAMYWYMHTDSDDANTPSSSQEMLECGNNRVCLSNGTIIKQNIKPHIAQALYGSGVFASYGSTGNTWIDCASPAVEHYGLKVFFPPTTVLSSIIYDPVVTYTISFRGVR